MDPDLSTKTKRERTPIDFDDETANGTGSDMVVSLEALVREVIVRRHASRPK